MWMEVGKVRLIQDSFSQVDIASGMAIEGMCYAQVCGCCPSPWMPVSRCWASGRARGTSCAIHDQLNRPLPAQRVSLSMTVAPHSQPGLIPEEPHCSPWDCFLSYLVVAHSVPTERSTEQRYLRGRMASCLCASGHGRGQGRVGM